jgi:hypothetical protein
MKQIDEILAAHGGWPNAFTGLSADLPTSKKYVP